MSWKDKCAVMGVWNHPSSAFLTYLGLYALQHRGQEGAGIVSSFKGRHFIHRARGLVGDIFSKEALANLKGSTAVGHTRYSTTGKDELKNIQPLTASVAGGPVAVAHNGNIINYRQLNKKLKNNSLISNNDTECVFPLLASFNGEPESLQNLSVLEGAFSLVLLMGDCLVAVRDPMGFRPLVLGQKDSAYFVASETCAFDLTGAKYLREIEPGEILVINQKGLKSARLTPAGKKARCIFEYVYFARPDSFVFGQNVYERRKEMGRLLAHERPVPADLVIPVPDSGVPAALGYAQESGIPFEMGIIRNHYVGRTFIHPSQEVRHFRVKIKLNPQGALLKGKRVIAVDDSIVRGTTSKSLVQILKQAGAKEVHLRVSSPPIKGPCFYGIDTPEKKRLISGNYNNIEELRKYFQADSLAYLSLSDLLKAGGGDGEFCLACFNEKYPTPLYKTLPVGESAV